MYKNIILTISYWPLVGGSTEMMVTGCEEEQDVVKLFSVASLVVRSHWNNLFSPGIWVASIAVRVRGSIAISSISSITQAISAISIGTIEKSRISISLGLGLSICRPLAKVVISSSIGISIAKSSISSISGITQAISAISISTIEKSRISLSLRLSISRPLAKVVVSSSIGISISSIA